MTVKDLCERLNIINNDYVYDKEVCHIEMDKALLDYINDKKVRRLFNKIEKWCA